MAKHITISYNALDAESVPESKTAKRPDGHFAEHPDHFDPRQYLGPAREEMKKLYEHKIVKVLGSNNKL